MFDDLNLLSTVILSAHWLIVIGLSLRVIVRRLPVGVSLAWLAVIFAVPFMGALAYLVVGGKRLDAKRVARQKIVQQSAELALAESRNSCFSHAPAAATAGEALYRQTLGLLGIPALSGNSVNLLRDYHLVFDALIADVDSAQQTCCLAFYIWYDGGRADDVVASLLRASGRGVRCRLLVDAVGSQPFLKGKSVRALRAAGVAVVAALPPSLHRRADLRNHRKIVVIDDRLGYTGSQNLVDPRFFKLESGVGQWVDAVVRIEGPAITQLANIFEQDWSVETGAAFITAKSWPADLQQNIAHGVLMQVVPSGPGPYPDAIRQLLLTAIYSARQTLILTTPYFVPDEAILTALLSAATRGVQITLIVPARNDSLLVRYASVAHFSDLLDAGVHIALFQGWLLHTKSMVVDDGLSLFGSVNLDMRSFWLNFEISLFVYGADFAAPIIEMQQDYLAHSIMVDAEIWRRRSARRRFLENLTRLAGPLL